MSGVTVEGDHRPHLYLMNADGTDLRRGDGRETETLVRPTWSPDGRRLAFAGFEDLAEMNLADGSVRVLVHASRLQIGSLAWSPDGTRIAFSAELRHVGD